MGRLGEKKTFVDEVYDEFLNLDYDVTDTDLNPVRDNKEKTEKAEDVLSKLYGIAEEEYKEVAAKYNIEDIEEIKTELTNTGEIVSVQKTLQEELLETRLGGSLANFGFLIDDNELPIEKDIKEMMLNLLIIEHHFGKQPKEEQDKDPKTGEGTDWTGEPETGPDEPGGPGPKPDDKDPKTGEGGGPDPGPDPGNDPDNDDANPYKISCFICNDEDGKKPTFSAKLTPAEVERLKNMGIEIEEDDETTTKKSGGKQNTEEDGLQSTSFSPKEVADCAKYDLQILRVILIVCKIIKVLTLILDPIYAITTQIVELAALACGCWRNPANIGEIVQRLIQVVISIATNSISILLDKLWKMLGLNCLTETSIDLINKIQNALTGIGKINQAVKSTANKFVKAGDDIYQDSTRVIQAWNDAKSQFLIKRENDFKSIFNKESMFSSEGFLQDFKNPLWNNISATGWLSGSMANVLGNTQVAKDIKDVKKLVNKSIEEFRGGKQFEETFGKESQRLSEFTEYLMKNTHFSETTDTWSEEAANFWNWNRQGENGEEPLTAGEALMNVFGTNNDYSSAEAAVKREARKEAREAKKEAKEAAKKEAAKIAAEQEKNEEPLKKVDNDVNIP
jgi:hypothetical protein